MLPFLCLTAVLAKTRPSLGYVVGSRGSVAIFPADKNAARISVVPGVQKKELPLHPGDRIELGEGAALKGVYDGGLLLLFGKSEKSDKESWIAPAHKSTALRQRTVAGSLMGRRQMAGGKTQKSSSFGIWPPSARVKSSLFVVPEGNFTLAWIVPEAAKTVTLTATVEGEKIGPLTVPAHNDVKGVSVFGLVSNGDFGRRLRSHSKEDAITPFRMELATDTGERARYQLHLSSRWKSRTEWEGPVHALVQSLEAAGPDSDEWLEPWNSALRTFENDVPSLRGYWITKLWSLYPDAFVTNDAVRQLAEEEGLEEIPRVLKRGRERD